MKELCETQNDVRLDAQNGSNKKLRNKLRQQEIMIGKKLNRDDKSCGRKKYKYETETDKITMI